jgi:Asp-tRNA(Asn)/Glu-tRNA(Gln) amidotransferase A subunit family amidase
MLRAPAPRDRNEPARYSTATRTRSKTSSMSPTSQLARAHSTHRPAPATFDSAAVAALRAAGMVLVGRTNMDELAYGMTSALTRNARDPERSPGASSGGSAGVAAEVPVALGSNTGGSVQVPAALNGVVDFKPSHGLISTAGTTVRSPSLDHIGIIARDVRDIGMLLGTRIGRPASRRCIKAPSFRNEETRLRSRVGETAPGSQYRGRAASR